MRRFRIALTATGLGALALWAGACGNGETSGVIRGAGHVEAIEVRLSAKVAGRLVEFAPREGDAVSAGQVVARIDTVDLALHAARLAAERDRAIAELALLEAGSRIEDIRAARARRDAAAADLAGADRDLVRARALEDSGAGTRQSREDAETRRDRARAALAALEEELERAEAGPRALEIGAARARQRAAEADLAAVRQQLADAAVSSPRNGVVAEKLAEAGELVTAGQPLALLVDLEDAWLNVYIPEADLGRIRLGQSARVVTDDGQERGGTLTYISPRAEFTPKNVQTRDERVKLVYRLKITLDNRDGLFKPGMPAEASLEAAPAAGAP